MPMRPKHPCAHQPCAELVDSRYCDRHADDAKQYDRSRGSSTARGYDRTWQKFRLMYLRRHTICEASEGCERPATEPHHIVRLQDGGARLSEDNLQALCHSHHSRLRGAGGRI